MRNRTTLTKSLHTVTVVSRVAADMAKRSAGKPDPLVMVYAALQLIGQGADWAKDDEVLQACLKATEKLMAKGG